VRLCGGTPGSSGQEDTGVVGWIRRQQQDPPSAPTEV
jgi:hypothetical protein